MRTEQFYWDGMFISRRGLNGPNVLYIHGLGESRLCWEETARAPCLAGLRHLMPDLPGYGKSLWSDPPGYLANFAGRLAGLLQEQSPEPAIVVGHSMGGVVGQLLGEHYPERVAGLVNVEGNLSMEDCTYSAMIAESGDVREFVSQGYSRVLDSIYQRGADDPVFRRYFASAQFCDPCSFHQNSLELVDASGREDLAGRMARLPFPSLYIAGLKDRPGRRSLDLLEQAGVQWVGFEKSAHWPFLDEPERFCQALEDFQRSIEVWPSSR